MKSLSIKDNGYYKVCLSKNGSDKNFHIHRLVAQMFVKNDNPLIKTQVNHKDEDKSNNSSENLEWVTPKENANYGTRIERHKKQVEGKNGAWARKVICVTTGEIFDCIIDASNKYNIFPQNIGNACKNGFNCGTLEDGTKLKWEYLNDVKYEEFKNYYAINTKTNNVIFIENSKKAKELGFNIRSVNKCLRNEQKTHKDFKFVKEIDDNEL